MREVPKYLTRYYEKGENPFNSLNDLPLGEANAIKHLYCKQNNIGGFYSQDDYLIHRLEIENWIRSQLISKGGNPITKAPVYMTLGDSPTGQFDIRDDLHKNAEEIKIPIDVLDMSAVTFTFPDSMYQIILDDNGNIIDGGRTNNPTVYLYCEIYDMMQKYESYLDEHYIEAQVWNRDMLNRFYSNCR
jgi:hypothetical protein